VLAIVSAVLRDTPLLFVQGNTHVQCYRSQLLWFYSNSSWMSGYCLKVCFLALAFFILIIMPLICVYAVLLFPMFCARRKSIFI